MTVPWIANAPPFPGPWFYSFNSGASYAPYAGGNQTQLTGSTGRERFRQTFTVPAGVIPTLLRVTYAGDLYDNNVNDPPQIRIDNANPQISGLSGGTVYIPMPAAGVHTFDIWVGRAALTGITRLDSVQFEMISALPCDCCPPHLEGCALVSVPFDSVSETTPEANWTPTNLGQTADGSVSGLPISGYTTVIGNTPSAALRITYVKAVQNRVRGVRIWNQAGGDLNDADGLNRFTAEFYAGAVLLATETWQVGNGGTPFTRTLSNGLELDGVTSVVLRNLDKQIGGNIAPLWREFQLLEFQPVFACRRRSGALEWYDEAGNLVASSDVTSCDTPTPWVPNSIVMTTQFFGDGPDPTAENLCNIIPTPSALVGFTPNGPSCYDPVSPGANGMTWGPTGSIEAEYSGGPGGGPSGGAYVTFTVPEGTISWPTSAFQMQPGETLMSNLIPGGHRAILTYVSGPAQNSPSGTIQPVGSELRLHVLATSVVAPIRFRLDFVTV